LNVTTVVYYTTEILCRHGLRNTSAIQTIAGVNIYPIDYFNPKSFETGKITITENTVSIHHFAASWHGKKEKLVMLLRRAFGKRFVVFLSNLNKKLRGDEFYV
jgi:hypothetical protein